MQTIWIFERALPLIPLPVLRNFNATALEDGSGMSGKNAGYNRYKHPTRFSMNKLNGSGR